MLALVTCNQARRYDTDLALLQRELPDARIVDWDDSSADWSTFGAVVVRSPWDYHTQLDTFLAWARRVDRVTRLWNPFDVIAWNTDKRYLAELERAGIAIVPTVYLANKAEVWAFAAAEGFDADVVIKPSIGASASGVRRSTHDRGGAAMHARNLIERGLAAMVQPYLAAVESRGETNLIYLGGTFSHAARRHVTLPTNEPPDDQPFGEETSVATTATTAERTLGDAVMELVPHTAYARIDIVTGPGGPMVLEVELTEPSLFLQLDPVAPARAASVFRSLVA